MSPARLLILFLSGLPGLPLFLTDVHTHHLLPLVLYAEGSRCGSARVCARLLCCFFALRHPHNPSLESFIWRWKWRDTIALKLFYSTWPLLRFLPAPSSAFLLPLPSSFDSPAAYRVLAVMKTQYHCNFSHWNQTRKPTLMFDWKVPC